MLREYEWTFLIHAVSRIYVAESYEALCDTVVQQLRTLVSFELGVCFQTERTEQGTVLSHPFSSDKKRDFSAFMSSSYPKWNEFVMAPESISFLQSDLIAPGKWESSRIYQDVWAPQQIYWGMFLSVVRQDCPLALFGFFRSHGEPDFNQRDCYIMNVLREALENRLYQLLHQPTKQTPSQDAVFIKSVASYGLTSREAQIAALIHDNLDTQAICEQLCISPSTLNKHLSNIFAKMKVKNRMQLFMALQDIK